MKTKLHCFFTMLALFALSIVTHATNITWTNAASGFWNNAANWSPNQVPGSTDNAYITNNGNYTVILNASAIVATLTLGGASGQQLFVQNANTLTLNGMSTVGSNGVFNLGSGTLGGSGPVTINGTFIWNSGLMANTGGVTLNGTSNLNGVGANAMQLYGLLINTGTLIWSGSGNNLYINGGATLTNLASGTITIANDVSTVNAGTIGNAGVLRKTAGVGTTTLNAVFVNTGTLDAQSGIVSLNGSYNLTNGTLNFGISGVTNFGKINLSGAAALTSTLSANLNGGYIPNSTNLFAVLSYSSKTAVFTSTNLPFANAWQVNYGSTNTTLQVLNARPLLTTAVNQAVNELTLLTATNNAVDLDTPPQTLTFSLLSAPNDMTNDPSTGVITWIPAQTQSPSTNTIVVSVTDNGTPPLSATNSFTIIVVEVNVAPVLPIIAQTNVNELALLTVANTATNANIHSTITGYTLVNPPAGASINASGIITWTPGLAQGPGTNTIITVVTNFNPYDLVNPSLAATNSFMVIVYAPTLAPIGNFTVNAGQTVSFTASATDNDSTRTLAFSLGTAPASATINPVNGLFNWRPPVTSAGSSNNIQVIVTDNSVPSLSATQSFYVLVNPLTSVTLTPVAITATNFQLQVSGPIGPDYILQANGSLANPNWLHLLTNTPVFSPFNVTDTNAPVSNQFYRILLSP